MDSDLVSRDSFDNYIYASNGGNPSVIIAKKANEEDAEYIAVRQKGAKYNDATSYSLYKKIGEVAINGTVLPLYVTIPKRGWSEKNGLNIYEYGDINFSANGMAVNNDIVYS